jgi:hypothetical protein
MSTEDVAFAMLGNIETAEQLIERLRRNRELGAVMRDVVADARRTSPVSYPGWGRPASEDAQRAAALAAPATPVAPGTGWVEARPLEVPGGATAQAAIEAMAHVFQPHGRANPEYRGPAAQSALAKAVAAARAAEPKAAQAAPVSAAPEVAEAAPEAEPAAPAAANAPEAKAVAGTLTRRRLA